MTAPTGQRCPMPELGQGGDGGRLCQSSAAIIREGEVTSGVQRPARTSSQHIRLAGDKTTCNIGLRSSQDTRLETSGSAVFVGQGLTSLC